MEGVQKRKSSGVFLVSIFLFIYVPARAGRRNAPVAIPATVDTPFLLEVSE